MKKIEIEGKVYDAVLDCGHLAVINKDMDNILNDELRELEGKKIRITIEVLEHKNEDKNQKH